MTEQKPHHLEQQAERFGRWDGRHPGYAEIKSGSLKKTSLRSEFRRLWLCFDIFLISACKIVWLGHL